MFFIISNNLTKNDPVQRIFAKNRPRLEESPLSIRRIVKHFPLRKMPGKNVLWNR
jgi:hypothetical protein